MRKMAELQMTVVTDPRSRIAIVKQIAQWEENLEKLYIDQYRFRCYIASLQGTELPNPKVRCRTISSLPCLVLTVRTLDGCSSRQGSLQWQYWFSSGYSLLIAVIYQRTLGFIGLVSWIAIWSRQLFSKHLFHGKMGVKWVLKSGFVSEVDWMEVLEP